MVLLLGRHGVVIRKFLKTFFSQNRSGVLYYSAMKSLSCVRCCLTLTRVPDPGKTSLDRHALQFATPFLKATHNSGFYAAYFSLETSLILNIPIMTRVLINFLSGGCHTQTSIPERCYAKPDAVSGDLKGFRANPVTSSSGKFLEELKSGTFYGDCVVYVTHRCLDLFITQTDKNFSSDTLCTDAKKDRNIGSGVKPTPGLPRHQT